jgi:putative membrane protein
MTTASSAGVVPFRKRPLLWFLCGSFSAVWIWSAWKPEIPEDWLLENLLVFIIVGVLLATHRWLCLSDVSYVLLWAFLCMHEVGAHYQYAGVPVGDRIRDAFQLARNPFDRAIHFAFGLMLAYPLRELILRKSGARAGWAATLAVMVSLALGAMYEITEAIVAEMASPEAGEAFLGYQGDSWDAQADMALGFAGAVLSMSVVQILKAVTLKRRPAPKK